jgi:O-antigen/teichoic acid export membrane protein
MSEAAGDIAKRDVARGAGSVALSRLGALIEIVTQPVFTWLFGLPTYGIYIMLWSAVSFVSNAVDLGFTGALQRVVPQADDETRAHAALKLALVVGMLPSLVIAIGVSLAAQPVSQLINAAPQDRAQLALAVALFAWALPLWTFVEIATAALRARRAFGPEIRLRIFWEQIVRLILALAAFAIGLRTLGLFVAHLGSLLVTAALSMRLLLRYYDPALLRAAPFDRAVLRRLLGIGATLTPAYMARRLYSDLPTVLLNLMLPGAAGASASGLYGIAHKIATVPQIVRQTFLYVMAPLASAQARRDRGAVQPLYAFATRLSTILVIPLTAAIVLLGEPILALFAPEARAALPILVVLIVARAAEACVGPASPILDVMGRRRWILFNAFCGVAVWLALAFVLVPRWDSVGMAASVGVGLVTAASLALIELRLFDRLDALSRRLWIGLGVSAATVTAMWLADHASERHGHIVEAIVVLALLAPALWLGLRFGLTRDDREALEPYARRLRLV